MDFMNFLPGIIGTVCSCGISIAVLGGVGFFLYRMFQGNQKNKEILEKGVSAPATIISAQEGGVAVSSGISRSIQVHLTLQVMPANRPPFQAVATTMVGQLQFGLISPGAQVMVKYDPNDITKVAIESLGGGGAMPPANVQALQNAVLAQDQYYEQLRRTGEEALAMIVMAEETNIRAGDEGSLFRFTMDVTPRSGTPFRAETQAAIADKSRYKYAVGKQVYVRFDPYGDRKQVAIDRAVEQ